MLRHLRVRFPLYFCCSLTDDSLFWYLSIFLVAASIINCATSLQTCHFLESGSFSLIFPSSSETPLSQPVSFFLSFTSCSFKEASLAWRPAFFLSAHPFLVSSFFLFLLFLSVSLYIEETDLALESILWLLVSSLDTFGVDLKTSPGFSWILAYYLCPHLVCSFQKLLMVNRSLPHQTSALSCGRTTAALTTMFLAACRNFKHVSPSHDLLTAAFLSSSLYNLIIHICSPRICYAHSFTLAKRICLVKYSMAESGAWVLLSRFKQDRSPGEGFWKGEDLFEENWHCRKKWMHSQHGGHLLICWLSVVSSDRFCSPSRLIFNNSDDSIVRHRALSALVN